ncbi:microfibril-associated glycoprotein 4-like [Styela clava]
MMGTVLFFMIYSVVLLYNTANSNKSTIVDVDVVQEQLKKLVIQVAKLNTSMYSKENIKVCGSSNQTNNLNPRIEKLYTSCRQLFSDGHNTNDVYRIWLFRGYRFISIFCDMKTVGEYSKERGWMVIQNRKNGVVNFDRGWNDYLHGFGFPDKEYWVGLYNLDALLHQNRVGTAEDNLALRIDMTDWDGVYGHTECNSFYTNPEKDDFRIISVGTCVGTPQIKFTISYMIGSRFSTFDHHSESRRPTECVRQQKGGWWFSQCRFSNLNGVYSSKREQMTKYRIFVRHWQKLNRNNTSLRYVSMKLQ